MKVKMVNNTIKILFLFLTTNTMPSFKITELKPSRIVIQKIKANCLLFFQKQPNDTDFKIDKLNQHEPSIYLFKLDNDWYHYYDLSRKNSFERNTYYSVLFHNAQNEQNNIEIIAFINQETNACLITKKENFQPFNWNDSAEE